MELISAKTGAELLVQGEVIAYPTEAVYGLGCDPSNEQALQTLLCLKNRPWEKGLILVASTLEQLSSFIDIERIPKDSLRMMHESWPGHQTWIVPAKKSVSKLLSGDSSNLAVRVTAHPICIELCNAFAGAIVSTSANPAGDEPARSISELQRIFEQAPATVGGDLGNANAPSRICDALTGKVLRE
ncbi:Sua5/YciO/YrdC/YwlC family protein [Paraferrimonas haliotis]|uniref:Threonylcarbamoyl-AMP synthase n=1 Tax=Paraferrimonas haliotis TaxID=2013866 RepID=A0AA37X0L2_9GAMM|nr:Sua5/YciO/YrdC/YwlC family protein [Paraferrimonas haliotis]GLS84831.1 threonylcarbamoyl-AMP synthase [Paraferrimonas haliotis]